MLHERISDRIERIEHPYYGSIVGFAADRVVFERARQGLTWEPHLIEQFGPHIRPGSIAIDCGANIGLHSLAMLFSQPALARLLAFEPNPEIFSVLAENVAGHPKIELINKGVSNASGTMLAPSIAEWENPAGAMLQNKKGLMQRLFGKPDPKVFREKDYHNGGYQVDVVSLDSMNLTNVSFIKIDVEGHEMSVIEGAATLLSEQRPALIVEIWDLEEPDLRSSKVNKIAAFGYDVVPISRIDTLFVPKQ